MTNKIKACSILDNAGGEIEYVALLYTRDNKFSKIEIHDISTKENYAKLVNYICSLDDNLCINNDEYIMSIVAFDIVTDVESLMMGLEVNRFDAGDIWGDNNES